MFYRPRVQLVVYTYCTLLECTHVNEYLLLAKRFSFSFSVGFSISFSGTLSVLAANCSRTEKDMFLQLD